MIHFHKKRLRSGEPLPIICCEQATADKVAKTSKWKFKDIPYLPFSKTVFSLVVGLFCSFSLLAGGPSATKTMTWLANSEAACAGLLGGVSITHPDGKTDFCLGETPCFEIKAVDKDGEALSGVTLTKFVKGVNVPFPNPDTDISDLQGTCYACPQLTVAGIDSIFITAEKDGIIKKDTLVIRTYDPNTTPPVLQCLKDYCVFLDASGKATIDVDSLPCTPIDPCGGGTLAASQTEFTCDDLDDVNVTVTYTKGAFVSTKIVRVTVKDTFAPIITCVDTIKGSLDENGMVKIDSNYLALNGFDFMDHASNSCGVDTVLLNGSRNPLMYDCDDLGEMFPVIVTAIDGSGNRAECETIIKIVDEISPKLNCTSQGKIDVLLDATGNGTFIVSDNPHLFSGTDNCGTPFFDPDTIRFTCEDIGVWTKRITLRDSSGGKAFCDVNFDVQDVTPPVIKCKYAIGSLDTLKLYLNEYGIAVLSPDSLDNGTKDSCTTFTLSVLVDTFTCNDITPIGTGLAINLYATDAFGNRDSCQNIIQVFDTLAPLIFCKDSIEVRLDSMGMAMLEPGDLFDRVKDECGIRDTTYSRPDLKFDCDDLAAPVFIDITVRDIGGRASTCQVKVIVKDEIAPVIECKENFTLELGADGKATLDYTDLLVDATDNCAIDTAYVDYSNFNCALIGSKTVTVTVKDESGNTSTCTTQVNIGDYMSPITRCKNITVFVGDGGLATITPEDVDNGSTDNCGIINKVVYPNTFDCSKVGETIKVVLTTTDFSGNSSSCNAWVTVAESSLPQAHCQDITVELDKDGLGEITLEEVDNGSSVSCNSPNMRLEGRTNFNCEDLNNDTLFVTLIVTDASGNEATCEAKITVVDKIAPMAICGIDPVDLPLGSNGTAYLPINLVNNGSSDNCGIETITLSKSSFTCDDLGENVISLIVVDSSGNADTCSRIINIVNSAATNLVCKNIEVYLDENGQVAILPEDVVDKAASDCFGNIPLELSDSTFTCDDLGQNTVRLTLVSGAYNNFCDAIVTVRDTLDPILECKDTTTIEVDAWGIATVKMTDVLIAAGDNCAIKDTIWTDVIFECNDILTSPKAVYLTVNDSTGNETTCTTMVTIVDNIDPTVVSCLPDTTIQPVKGYNCKAPFKFRFPTFNDNCSIVDTVISPAYLSVEGDSISGLFENSTVVTVTVTDIAGNEVACSFTVTVADTEDPTFGLTCPSFGPQVADPGVCGRTYVPTNLAPDDNCGIATYECIYDLSTGESLTSTNTTAPVFLPVGVNTITHIIKDYAGNEAKCIYTIEVVDNEDPTLVFNNNHPEFPLGIYSDGDTVNIPAGTVPLYTIADVDADDNCAIDKVEFEDFLIENGVCNSKGYDRLYRCVWTATDLAGNTSEIIVFLKVACDAGPSIVTKNISLKKGWNLISSNVIPANTNMTSIFSAISSNVDIVKDELGNAYIPSLGINGIGNWNIAEGYQVKVNADVTLSITGTKVAVNTPIAIDAGWQFIPYYGDGPMNIVNALPSISGVTLIVKDNAGNTYIPSLGINSIGNMNDCQGYQVKASSSGTLVYPE